MARKWRWWSVVEGDRSDAESRWSRVWVQSRRWVSISDVIVGVQGGGIVGEVDGVVPDAWSLRRSLVEEGGSNAEARSNCFI